MHEPKFKLNTKDEARYSELVVRHALECGKKKYKKYPPLTREENLEMERLQKKREKKGNAHPKMRAALRCQRNHDRKLEQMFGRILMRARVRYLALYFVRRLNKLKIKVDRKK